MSIDIPIISSFVDKGIKDAIKKFQQLETTSDKAQFAISKAAVPAAAALAGIATLAGKAVKQASDLGEAQNKANVIFQDAAKDITNFADTASTKLGQSKTDAINAAATFGTFGKSAGLAGEDLGKFAINFTTLASDMASFNNTTPEEAVLAIGAALRGEAEPIRRFGVLLNDAAIKSEAVTIGLIKTTKEGLTPQQKVLAVQSAILKQTSDQQGDFAKTSDTLANSQRILAAEIEDVSTEFGMALLPAIEGVLPHLKTFAQIAKDNPDDVKKLAVAITAMATATVALNIAMKTNPWILMAGGVLVANEAMEKLLNFIDKVGGIVGFLGKIAGSLSLVGFAGKVVGDLFKKAGDDAEKAGIKIGDSMTRAKASIEGVESALMTLERAKAVGPSLELIIGNVTALGEAYKKTEKQGSGLTAEEKRQAAALEAKAKAMKKTQDAIASYLNAYSSYSASIKDTITGFVSISEAQQTAAASEGKISTGQAFQKQIADAKQFANNLKTLLGMGLGQAGLAQLLNLGPIAGLQVTDSMILGGATTGNPGGFGVNELNSALADLASVGGSLGGAAASAFMTRGGGTVNNITVNASLVSTPAQIGQDIIDVIQKAQRLSGQVFAAA